MDVLRAATERDRQARDEDGRPLANPPVLWDIESEEDLFEDVARPVGLNELPEGLPPVAIGARADLVAKWREKATVMRLTPKLRRR